MELLVVVLSCFAAAGAAPALHRVLRHRTGALLAFLPAAVFVYLATLAPGVAAGLQHVFVVPWAEGLGVHLALRLDGLALMFAMLISGIGALVSLYAGTYLRNHVHLGRFFLFLYLFMGAMLGLVLADDLIVLFVFWELTSISSYFLIGFNTEDAASRRSALQALLVTGAGGLALLAGLVLIGIVAGQTPIGAINTGDDLLRDSSLYVPILVLVLAGAFTKSAQFPFHFWLPGAMAAPTPVSAYLHSATMVKAGIYLLARFSPSLGGTSAWTASLVLFGLATFLIGTVLALRQTDLKLILAYTTVASLGLLTLMLGIGTPLAVQAAMAFLLAHALYKGTLFLVSGAVDHATGTRDVRLLGGLRKAMPYTAGAALVAALSFVGLPPIFGFIAKEALLGALLEESRSHALALGVAVLLVGAFLAAYIAAVRPFWGAPGKPPQEPHEAPPALLAGPLVLATASLVFGLVPYWADKVFVSPASSAVLAASTHAHLVIWHGLNLPLGVSALILVSGLALVASRLDVRRGLDRLLHRTDNGGPQAGYDATVRVTLRLAKALANLLQDGRLRIYLTIILGVTAAAVSVPLVWLDGAALTSAPGWDMRFHEVVVVLVLIVSALALTRTKGRLAAVAVLGMVGYAVATLFIFYSAPDLAMTQFLFETLSVLLFAYVLWNMPKLSARSAPRSRLRDAVVCGAVGLLMGWLALLAMTERFHDPISSFYATQSYIEAHGRNVVNVILVDFRGIDTLGEITVLAVAALGVAALLRLRPSRGAQ